MNINIQVALALSAASALIYEVVAANLLFFYFIESSYSVSTVLGTFLFGLGAGSLIIYWLSNRIKKKRLLLGCLQICIAIYAFIMLTNLQTIIPKISTTGTFTTTFIMLLIPTLFLGATFPLAASLFKSGNKDKIGLVYSSDLAGAIFGCLVAGFILIPMFGNTTSVLFGVCLNLLSAVVCLGGK